VFHLLTYDLAARLDHMAAENHGDIIAQVIDVAGEELSDSIVGIAGGRSHKRNRAAQQA